MIRSTVADIFSYNKRTSENWSCSKRRMFRRKFTRSRIQRWMDLHAWPRYNSRLNEIYIITFNSHASGVRYCLLKRFDSDLFLNFRPRTLLNKSENLFDKLVFRHNDFFICRTVKLYLQFKFNVIILKYYSTNAYKRSFHQLFFFIFRDLKKQFFSFFESLMKLMKDFYILLIRNLPSKNSFWKILIWSESLAIK